MSLSAGALSPGGARRAGVSWDASVKGGDHDSGRGAVGRASSSTSLRAAAAAAHADGDTEMKDVDSAETMPLRVLRFLAEGSSGRIALAAWADDDADAEDGAESKHAGSSGESKSAGSAAGSKAERARLIALASSFPGLLPEEHSNALRAKYPPELDMPRPRPGSRKRPLALKVIDKKTTGKLSTAEQIDTEISMMRAVCADNSSSSGNGSSGSSSGGRSPFVVQFFFARELGNTVYIGMELCLGGDLFTLLNYEALRAPDVAFYAAEAALGLQHLHDRNMIHGDLKPENIALAANGHVRLIDFGLSVMLDPERDRNPQTGRLEVLTQSGTLPYCAPEILQRQRHGVETDWWSFAVIVYEMLFGCLPWYDDDDQNTCALICTAPLEPPTEDTVNARCFDLIERMLEKPPASRLGYEHGLVELKQHKFFRRVDWARAYAEDYRPPFVLES